MRVYAIIWNDFYSENYWDCEVAESWEEAYKFACWFLKNFMLEKGLPFNEEEAFDALANDEYANDYIHIEICAKTLL